MFDKRKAFGQHFLRDPQVIHRIVETGSRLWEETRCAALLEIGPGKGAITRPLLDQLKKKPDRIEDFLVAERDRELAAQWRTVAESAPLRVEEGDFMDLPEDRWLTRQPLAVISNLPYSAGTAIVTRLAKFPHQIGFMLLMFQAEVARRLRAEPGTKEWGSLSIWMQNRWDVSLAIKVPPGAFKPPPKVDSEVVVLRPRSEPRIRGVDGSNRERLWETLLRVGFAHRRKMLRSGLPSTGPWRNALDASGLDGTKRPEALSWAEWQMLFDAASKIALN